MNLCKFHLLHFKEILLSNHSTLAYLILIKLNDNMKNSTDSDGIFMLCTEFHFLYFKLGTKIHFLILDNYSLLILHLKLYYNLICLR